MTGLLGNNIKHFTETAIFRFLTSIQHSILLIERHSNKQTIKYERIIQNNTHNTLLPCMKQESKYELNYDK